MNSDILAALYQAAPEDLETILQYVIWVKFRRRVHDRFYIAAHWVRRPIKRAHWI